MNATAFDLKEFQTRLEETAAWYLSKAPVTDPEYGLRTAALAPPAGFETPTDRELGDPPTPWIAEADHEYWRRKHEAKPQILKERQEIVDAVAEKRRALLTMPRTEPSQIREVLGKGRLLLYYPDENLSDGAAPLNSERFFDDENAPPWDTWLVYVIDSIANHETYLLAWVPPECLELATGGIEANPEYCIRWAADADAKVVRQLRSAGLLR
jgi:hypothetical protein